MHKITATLDSCPGPAAAAVPSPVPAQSGVLTPLPSLAAFVQWNFCSSTENFGVANHIPILLLLLLACPSVRPSVCLYLKCGKYLFATPEIRVAKGNGMKRSELRRNSLIAFGENEINIEICALPAKSYSTVDNFHSHTHTHTHSFNYFASVPKLNLSTK